MKQATNQIYYYFTPLLCQYELKVVKTKFQVPRNIGDFCLYLQVNALQQLQNIASYTIIKDKLEHGEVRLHALWFDIYGGDFYLFSRSRQRFLPVTEEFYRHLVEDGEGEIQSNL